MAGTKRLPATLASVWRTFSMSSRNFKNIIQVSIGNRSRSPFKPLSLRIMSRQDFTRLPNDWAVVNGTTGFELVRGIRRLLWDTVGSSSQIVSGKRLLRSPYFADQF